MKSSTLFLTLFLTNFSINTFGQTFDDPQDHLYLSDGPVHIGELLLTGVKEGKLKLLSFETEDQQPQEITLNDIYLSSTGFEQFDWDEEEIYYEGDIVEYEGNQYISIIDENIGKHPTQLEFWDIWAEIWAEIYGANYFYIESGSDLTPTYAHLYHKYDETDPAFTYLASFHASEAQQYLNEFSYLYYETDDYDHLTGSIFLPPGLTLYKKLAEVVNITIDSEKMTRNSSFANEWHFLGQNLASDQPGKHLLIFGPDSLMFLIEEEAISSLDNLKDSEFYLLGDALISGKTFSELTTPISEIEATSIDIISTNIVEQIYPLDSLYLVENGSKVKSPVSLFDVSIDDWTEFVDNIIESTKNETITAYTNSKLDQKITTRDFDLRLMLYEDDMADWDFELDEWDKEIRYFMGDQAEYAGIKYESTQDENTNHLPSQWPEYWQPADESIEFFYPADLQVLWVKSKINFNISGEIREVKPEAFALVVPGSINITGFMKEIAWFDIQEIAEHTSENQLFQNIMKQIQEHNFYSQMLSYDPLRAR